MYLPILLPDLLLVEISFFYSIKYSLHYFLLLVQWY